MEWEYKVTNKSWSYRESVEWEHWLREVYWEKLGECQEVRWS